MRSVAGCGMRSKKRGEVPSGEIDPVFVTSEWLDGMRSKKQVEFRSKNRCFGTVLTFFVEIDRRPEQVVSAQQGQPIHMGGSHHAFPTRNAAAGPRVKHLQKLSRSNSTLSHERLLGSLRHDGLPR